MDAYTKKQISLESSMIRYQDLLSIPVKDNNESFVTIDSKVILNGYIRAMSDMAQIIEKKIIVRKTVYAKLQKSQKILQNINPDLTLYVTYGYRSLEIQTKYFLEQLKNTITKFYENPIDLYEEVHRFIAVPTVAGHPTGGAVDIVIKNKKNNTILDFGSEQYDYSTKDCYVFTDHISDKAKTNRQLLRSIMMKVGFAPFDGEWWHFSYGDREWAFYFKLKSAIYDQVMLKDIQ